MTLDQIRRCAEGFPPDGHDYESAITWLANEVMRLSASQSEAVERDAARYRWLRQSDCRDGVPFIAIFDGRLSQWTGKPADEQLDIAMRQSAGEGKE